MFVLFNSNKALGKFSSYEAARQAARKRVRKVESTWSKRYRGSNPVIGEYGFLIRQI